MTKIFPLNVVLTVTTGRLLTSSDRPNDNGIGDLYEILNHMTNDNLFTHQLPRAGKECTPWLLVWFPELKPVLACKDKLDDWLKKSPTCPQVGIQMWLTELKMLFPDIKDQYEVKQIPKVGHDVIDPIEELKTMRNEDSQASTVHP